jgi:ammonium transporter, Amt family
MDFEGIGRVAANTTLAAAAGGLVAVLAIYPRTKKWDLGISINGFLGGLVAITAPCYWVSPFGAIVIGAVAAVVVIIGVDLLEHLRIDDPIGAWPVHGFAGIWGTLSIGLLATGQYGIPGADGPDTTTKVEGLFYGGGLDQLKAQFIGSLAAVVAVSAMSIVLMYAVKSVKLLRVEEQGELEGIDIFEHGTPAYHMEFGQGMTYSAPIGSTSSFPPPADGDGDGKVDETETPVGTKA